MASVLRKTAFVLAASVALGTCGSSAAKVAARATTTSTAGASESSTEAVGGTASSGTIGPGSTVKASGGATATTARGAGGTTTIAPATTTTTRTAPPGAAGVRGVVTAGPQCPVQRQGDHSCDDKPVAAHLELQRADGTGAASGDAGADGQFFVAAAPGSYTLAATSPNAMHCASQPVTVTAGHVTDVQVSCDTGIR